MRVLVTGGAGYIGSVVTEQLLGAGHSIVVLDSMHNGHRDAVDARAELVVGDVGDERTIDAVLSKGIDAVVHMAAHSIVPESMKDPAKYFRNNVSSSLVLLDAMRTHQVRHFVFSSTAAVYGEPTKQPIDESAATEPTNAYGETKLQIERVLPWFERAHGMRHVSLRYFNAAGASEKCGERHDPETHLVPIVLEAALGRRPEVVLMGDDYPTRDGTCVRDYIHVIDLARAHVVALEALASGKPSAIYNLGCGGDGYTVREVIDAARRVTGREVPVRVGPRREGDPPVLIASSDKITRELGYRPLHQSLDAILESAFRFLSRRL